MAISRLPGVAGMEGYDFICPDHSPGILGFNDRGDPAAPSFSGDTPGIVGVQDAAAEATSSGFAIPTYSSPDLTPLEFEAIYHALPVPYEDPDSGARHTVEADIHIYANAGIARRSSEMTEKDRLVGLIRSELRRSRGATEGVVRSEHRSMVAHVFFAKGTPAECLVTCMHAIRYGRATPSGLQAYIDSTARIGLDCSGFVNSYFLATGRITAAQPISAYARATARSAASEVDDLDVLIWDGGDGGAAEHIAVVDHVVPGSSPLRMVVVESSGSKEGLVNSEYTVLNVSNQSFQVDRGGDAQGRQSRSRVRIVAPPGG